jgi:hypothetical protein
LLPQSRLVPVRFGDDGNVIASLPPTNVAIGERPPHACFHHVKPSASTTTTTTTTSREPTLIATFRTLSGLIGGGMAWLVALRGDSLRAALAASIAAESSM